MPDKIHYLINPGGRLVEVNDATEAAYLQERRGFREASSTELAAYMTERQVVLKEVFEQETKKDGRLRVFFKTVRSGPDGYGMSRGFIKGELMNLGISMEESFDEQRIGLLYGYPYSVVQLENDIRVIYTMFESDKIPAEWPNYLEAADLVLVPSRFIQKALKDAGVESTVVPLGYNDKVFKFYQRKPKTKQGDIFTFLHYSSFNIRKGFSEVFQAFTEEFDEKEPVELILKSAHEHPPLPIPRSQYPNIRVICEKYGEAQLFELLKKADCFVYPSRGEGFGITPLEAMATGMPAIVPNAHGISEYFNPEFMTEVKVAETCPGLYHRFKGQDVGKMVICSVKDLRKKMRAAYENQKAGLEMGKAASEYVKAYTYEKTAAQLKSILEELNAKPIVKRKDSEFLAVKRI